MIENNNLNYWLIGFSFPVLTLISFLLTGLFRKRALKVGALDHPNHRSAHSLPVPRSGGSGFVITFLSSLLVLWLLNYVSAITALVFLPAGLCVSAVGYVDDRFTLSVIARLGVQVIAAVWGLVLLSGFPQIGVAQASVFVVIAINVCALFYLLWLTNLYNFMDGIDGLAGLQAVSVALGMCTIQLLSSGELNGLLLVLGSSILGFLIWNFPKARIFMGDVGSGFLGLILGLMSIQVAWGDIQLFYGFLILMAVFITDASLTLVRRFVRNEKVYLAHNTHAYQYAARKYNSHVVVSLFVLFYNVLWLLPLAFAVSQRLIAEWLGLLLAYLPTLIIAVFFKAGKRQEVSIHNCSHG